MSCLSFFTVVILGYEGARPWASESVTLDESKSNEETNSSTTKSYDPERTGRLAAYRGLIYFPCYVLYLRNIDRLIPARTPVAVATKVLLDQSTWTVFMHTAFLGGMALAEGGSIQDAKDRCNDKLLPLLKVNWVFWGMVQIGLYGVVPLPLRPAVVSTIMIGWNGYMSNLNEEARREQAALALQTQSIPAEEVTTTVAMKSQTESETLTAKKSTTIQKPNKALSFKSTSNTSKSAEESSALYSVQHS